jgi:hypothetical protein
MQINFVSVYHSLLGVQWLVFTTDVYFPIAADAPGLLRLKIRIIKACLGRMLCLPSAAMMTTAMVKTTVMPSAIMMIAAMIPPSIPGAPPPNGTGISITAGITTHYTGAEPGSEDEHKAGYYY